MCAKLNKMFTRFLFDFYRFIRISPFSYICTLLLYKLGQFFFELFWAPNQTLSSMISMQPDFWWIFQDFFLAFLYFVQVCCSINWGSFSLNYFGHPTKHCRQHMAVFFPPKKKIFRSIVRLAVGNKSCLARRLELKPIFHIPRQK